MHPTLSRALSSPIQANVLVAMCDLSRFTQSTKGHSSAELFAELNAFYAVTEEVIGAAGGQILKFIGDAALIVFPEDLADQGIMALLDLKGRVDHWLQDHPIGHSLFVNVHFGEVTLGRMGRAGNLDVMGETVLIAAKLGARGFGISQQAFRSLSPDNRKRFHKFTPPVLYLASDEA